MSLVFVMMMQAYLVENNEVTCKDKSPDACPFNLSRIGVTSSAQKTAGRADSAVAPNAPSPNPT